MQMDPWTNGTLLSLLLLYVAIVAVCLNNVYMGEKDKEKKASSVELMLEF